MSSQEFDPTNQAPVVEQIPHSGVYGFEKPVHEFVNTSLAEADAQGLIETPATPEALVDMPNDPARYVERRHTEHRLENPSKLKRTIVGVGTAAIAIAGVAFGISKLNNHEQEQGTIQGQETSQSLNPKPSPEKPIVQETGVGVQVHTFEDLNVAATPKLTSEAEKPVMASEYTPEEAYKRLMADINVYLLGAQAFDDKLYETPESKAKGEVIWSNIFGDADMQAHNKTGSSIKAARLRGDVGSIFKEFYDEDGEPYVKEVIATWHETTEMTGPIVQNGPDTWTIPTSLYIESNFHELDSRMDAPEPPSQVNIVMQVIDGQYFLTRL